MTTGVDELRDACHGHALSVLRREHVAHGRTEYGQPIGVKWKDRER